uniref:Family with sequence similarity 91 member A1 n=1 Tax=Erpetoichthys calabaricus TaxID=27687 RepID=A0A8C4SV30_ERPCA
MNTDVEFHIRQNYPWTKLPANVKQSLGNSQREYDKQVLLYSIQNQLRFRNNLVRHVKKDERKYYEELLKYSREHLMLYPYHLSDIMVKGLRVTPFLYYIGIMEVGLCFICIVCYAHFNCKLCLRLLGIGRNQYIDLMNQCRSSKKFFRRKSARDLLPLKPVDISVEPWWVVQAGFITEDDIRICSPTEKSAVDKLIDSGPQLAGLIEYNVVLSLYNKGFIYLDVPISDDSCIAGEFISETIHNFLSLAALNAVSMYCRLGFAVKKGQITNADQFHPSWRSIQSLNRLKSTMDSQKMLLSWEGGNPVVECSSSASDTNSQEDQETSSLCSLSISSGHTKRIAFLLIQHSLHAVTMFEVGKLSDESLDSFLVELEKVQSTAEGEAQRYFEHAVTLRNTILFLRHNKDLTSDPEQPSSGFALDLLRCESLLGLDSATCSRVLNKNYKILVSMAPLSNEIRPISSCTPQHIGPAIPEISSIWFKLYLYHICGKGPPSLLLSKGVRLRKLPGIFQEYSKLLVTSWGHDPGIVLTSNVLTMLNDALTHSAVLIQGHTIHGGGETVYVPFPFDEEELKGDFSQENMAVHKALKVLRKNLDLEHTSGYITMLNPRSKRARRHSDSLEEKGFSDVNGSTESFELVVQEPNSAELSKRQGVEDESAEEEWVPLDVSFGIPLFNSELNGKVCQKIVTHGLCGKESLKKLLHSSRKLSLKVLSFVQSFQCTSLTDSGSEYNASYLMNPSSLLSDVGVPLPSKSLVFKDGVLSEWSEGALPALKISALQKESSS